MWELDNQQQHLERSLASLRRCYEQGVTAGNGYCAINLAYVLDLLAHQELAEAKLTRILIVQRIAKDFLAGVQRNIRTRMAASFPTNF
jgi:hypothetical protein